MFPINEFWFERNFLTLLILATTGNGIIFNIEFVLNIFNLKFTSLFNLLTKGRHIKINKKTTPHKKTMNKTFLMLFKYAKF